MCRIDGAAAIMDDTEYCAAVCTQWKGEVRGNEGQQVEWCSVSELRRREMPPGDLPLIDAVERAIHDHAQSPLSITA
jgi:hypothetical protein